MEKPSDGLVEAENREGDVAVRGEYLGVWQWFDGGDQEILLRRDLQLFDFEIGVAGVGLDFAEQRQGGVEIFVIHGLARYENVQVLYGGDDGESADVVFQLRVILIAERKDVGVFVDVASFTAAEDNRLGNTLFEFDGQGPGHDFADFDVL